MLQIVRREDLGKSNTAEGTIITVTGRVVDPWRMRPEDFHLIDIACALSKLCRYAGQIDCFYSVAEHCVGVVELMLRDGVEDTKLLRTGLMHDASEAYLVDMPSPIKRRKEMAPYVAAEERCLVAMAHRFDLYDPLVDDEEWKNVKYYDQEMYRNEVQRIRIDGQEGLHPNDARQLYINTYVQLV